VRTVAAFLLNVRLALRAVNAQLQVGGMLLLLGFVLQLLKTSLI
jgi:hypothetical protein